MLERIRITGLFNRFNYDINFKNNITILTGPNGYGKTTVLRIIRDVLEDQLYDLYSLCFNEILLVNSKKKEVKFTKDGFGLLCNGEYINVPSSIDTNFIRGKVRLTYYDGRVIYLAKDQYFEYNEEEIVYFYDYVILGDIELKRNEANLKGGNFKNPKYLKDISELYGGINNAYYLGAQRLYILNKEDRARHNFEEPKKQDIEVINTLSNTLNKSIIQYNYKYTNASTSKDSLFLLELSRKASANTSKYTKEDYYQDLEYIENKTSKLMEYKLINKNELENFRDAEFLENYSLVYKLFVQNYKLKLEVFEPLIDKFDLFTSIINNKLLNKTISISSGEGIVVKSHNEKLELSNLSSGEKELIVMYFSLLFNSDEEEYGLFLVDEPELSLHIEWQYDIVHDLEKISDLVGDNKIQFIICTHSPQIVNDRWQDTIDLANLDKNNG